MAAADDPAAHYDRVTRAWTLLLGEDLHYGLFEQPEEPLAAATARLTERMAERAELRPGLRVLDVGCGTGHPACTLAERFGCAVTGITTSAEGVALARARAAALGVVGGRVEIRLADAMDNGLPEASFDRVWALESSHLMPRKGALLAECARVLRPGGRLVLCDIVRRADLPLAQVLRHARAFDTLRVAFGRARMEPLATYAELARAAGLDVLGTWDLTAATRPTFAAWRANAATHHDEVGALLGAPGLAAFEASCDILERFWDDGTLGYGLMAAEKTGAGSA